MGKRRLLMDALSNAVAFLLIFNIFALPYAMLNGRAPWPYLFLAVPFFFLFFLRGKVIKMRYFIAIHAAMMAVPFVTLGNPRIFAPLICFAIASAIYSLHTRGKGEWSMPGTAAAWVIAVFAALSMLFVAYVPEIGGFGAMLNISSLISLAAIVLYVHLDNMRVSLNMLKGHRKTNAETSTTSNILIAVFLVMILVFGALSILFPSEAAVLVVGRLLLDIALLPINFLVSLAQFFFGEAGSDYMGMPPILEGGGGGAHWAAEDLPDESLLHAIFNIIIVTLTTLILLALATVVIVTLFRRLYKAFNKKDSDSEKQSLMPDDIKSKFKFILGDMKELLPRFKLGVRHPIRRAYIKKINSHIKQGFRALPHYTPDVIAEKIHPTEDINELTKKYEEVRYGKT